MSDDYPYDVFLSHSSEDKAVVRPLAERLRADGLRVWLDVWEIKPGDNIPAKIEEGLEQSRVLVLCMSANAFGSRWAQLEAGTFRFRDPLNKERRLIPLRLDDAPIKGSLAQFSFIDWRPASGEAALPDLLAACRRSVPAAPTKGPVDSFILVGYLYVENDGEETLLVAKDCADGQVTYRFPFTSAFHPTAMTVEQAIDAALGDGLPNLGLEVGDLRSAGFAAPEFRQIYRSATVGSGTSARQILIQEPIIFFKMRVHTLMDCGEAHAAWIAKPEATAQWGDRRYNPMPEYVTVDVFHRLMAPWFSIELGFRVLECVDILLFRFCESRGCEFFMFHLDGDDGKSGWEYVKGKLLYHESILEAALRKLYEEAGIPSSRVRYCGSLGWQTVDVTGRHEVYDTLRTHGLVFLYLGADGDICPDPQHNQQKWRWVGQEEAKSLVWMGSYARRFLDIWEHKRDLMLFNAGLHATDGLPLGPTRPPIPTSDDLPLCCSSVDHGRNRTILQQMRLVVIEHACRDTQVFLSLLKDTGVDIHAFVAKPYSISGGVVGYLRQLGVPVELWSYADLEEAMVLPALLRAAIKASRADGRALVLIDIGGYFSFHLPVLAPEDSSLVAGVVEVTSFGEERYARCATATRVPVVSVARNAIKEIEADIVVARALEVVERLVRPLDRQLTGATALVIGYGTIGQALALALRARGADVAVHDAEAQQELSAWWAGFGTGDKATLLREASFVFSATGAEGLSADGIGLCADRAVLVSLGSKDTEFDLAGLVGSGARQTLVADGLTEYQIASGKRVYVVRDGTAANFEVDSGPTASSDLLFTEIVAAMLALATRDERLQRGSLNALPRDIVNDVSRRWLEHASTSGKCVGWGARVC